MPTRPGARRRASKKFTPALREARTALGISQSELAGRIGIGQADISRMESGRRQIMPYMAERIGRALGVHPARVLWADVIATSRRARA